MSGIFRAARPFSCAQLEALFRHQLLHRSASDLLRLLSVLVPVLLLLALVRVPRPDPSLLWLAGFASVGLGQLFMNRMIARFGIFCWHLPTLAFMEI